jgi:hypothetical protein
MPTRDTSSVPPPQMPLEARRPGASRLWRTSRQSWVHLLTLALGGRALWLSVQYLGGHAAVRRFHVEAAAVAFVVVGLCSSVLTRKDSETTMGADTAAVPLWTLPAWWAAAVMLYWPALTLGYLSDDFVLVQRARTFQFGAFNPEAFRPVPLMVWAVLLHLNGGAVAIHLVNVVLHGTNAFLATRMARPLASSHGTAALAGLLFLTTPIGPEAVAWNAGVFDVMATTLVLAAMLIGRGYSADPSALRRCALVATGMAAFLCKETAMVAGLLIGLDGYVRDRRARKLYIDAAVLTTIAVAVIGLRLTFGSSDAREAITKYMVQRWVFGTFGGLVVPWHINVVQSHAWLPMLGVVGVVVLLSSFFVRSHNPARRRVVIAGAAWCLLGTLPAITLFFVAPDLQGARYLYLSSVGYGAMLLALGPTDLAARRAASAIAVAAVGILIVAGTVGVRLHLEPWRQAALKRDRVLAAARLIAVDPDCKAPVFRSLPDTVDGAYVFRNGGDIALGSSVSIRASEPDGCSFRWNGNAFEREGR